MVRTGVGQLGREWTTIHLRKVLVLTCPQRSARSKASRTPPTSRLNPCHQLKLGRDRPHALLAGDLLA
jgi:hypothetical protein